MLFPAVLYEWPGIPRAAGLLRPLLPMTWEPGYFFLPFPYVLCLLTSCTYVSDIDSSHSQILSGPGRIQVRVNKKLFLWTIGKLMVNYPLRCFKCLMQDGNSCVLRVGGLWELYYFLLSWMWLDKIIGRREWNASCAAVLHNGNSIHSCSPRFWWQCEEYRDKQILTRYSKNSCAPLMYSWTQLYFQRAEFERESPVKAKMLPDRSDPQRPGYLKSDLYSFRSESALYFNNTAVLKGW